MITHITLHRATLAPFWAPRLTTPSVVHGRGRGKCALSQPKDDTFISGQHLVASFPEDGALFGEAS